MFHYRQYISFERSVDGMRKSYLFPECEREREEEKRERESTALPVSTFKRRHDP